MHTYLSHAIKLLILFIFLCPIPADAQQLSISRIDQMPNMPGPYEMRDWAEVTRGYDSLVFDFDGSGEYLPLIFWRDNTTNYPNHRSFGLHTVVGTTSPTSGEAINVLPAVISASLVGIDKSQQDGHNWVLMCEEFFNRRPEENVYLNHPVAQSGSDWWYDTMPNVFFYQLYDLYPETGDFEYQLTAVADQWLKAVRTMGGRATPWHRPYMNYRGWYLSSMTPNTATPSEPEAAGAIAWLLYNAYTETGEERYRIGAEWAMEFLNSRTSNPSYELQLPYGVYIAARMNAELNTEYDVEKLLNWCFTPQGNVRTWGVTLGRWGEYDCYGLKGEAKTEGYAFAMNTFEQVGTLVPMLRYDDRFARAIGKWVLNAANAARLFYPNYLPPENQDSEEWSFQYDPHSYIAHESMREEWSGISPYATGDAVRDGWGRTNLALYGSSHVGIFGGIIDTTTVEGILQLDLLKTDYFGSPAYPTYLYYNPHREKHVVQVDLPQGSHRLYNAITNTFIQESVSGSYALSVDGEDAVMLVIVPSDGGITYHLDKTLVNGRVIDYRSGREVSNYPPRIKSLAANAMKVMQNDTTTVHATAADRETDQVSYEWSVTGGMISEDGSVVIWQAPEDTGEYQIRSVVTDEGGLRDTADITLTVIDNRPPVIQGFQSEPEVIAHGGITKLTCNAIDEDGDSLVYRWSSAVGTFLNNDTPTVQWYGPETAGLYSVKCTVSDGKSGEAVDSISVVVGHLVAYFPFTGNAMDSSDFGNHGQVHGSSLVADRHGTPDAAYRFDGDDDFVRVPVHSSLNMQRAISVNFWMRADKLPDSEQFPISHGSWQNRWKVSVIPDRRVRWTLKTDTSANGGIIDLDSETHLSTDRYYMVTVTYDGSEVAIYLDGEQESTASWGGHILRTDIDLTIGQMLPGDNGYNFNGILDDIRIYNRALSEDEIGQLFQRETGIGDKNSPIPQDFVLAQNYPNPFNAGTTIRFGIPGPDHITIAVYNISGELINRLTSAPYERGWHTVHWNGRDQTGERVSSGLYICWLSSGSMTLTRKMVLVK